MGWLAVAHRRVVEQVPVSSLSSPSVSPRKLSVRHAADHLLAQIAGDPFGAVIPEQYFSFAIDDVDGNVKVVEDAAKEIDFSESRHSELRGFWRGKFDSNS